MTAEKPLHAAIHAATQALAVAEGAFRAARETLAALLAAFTEAPPSSSSAVEWLDADEIATRCKVPRRSVLTAHRKGHLRASRLPGTRTIIATPHNVDDWIRGRDKSKGKP